MAEAGAFSMVIEAVAEPLGASRSPRRRRIPTIGIGASAACDGQVLVLEDMLGLSPRVPKFVRRYGDLGPSIEAAVEGYAEDVRARAFPGPEHRLRHEDEALRGGDLPDACCEANLAHWPGALWRLNALKGLALPCQRHSARVFATASASARVRHGARTVTDPKCLISFKKLTKKCVANSSRSCGTNIGFLIVGAAFLDRRRGRRLAWLSVVARPRRRPTPVPRSQAAADSVGSEQARRGEAAFAKIADRRAAGLSHAGAPARSGEAAKRDPQAAVEAVRRHRRRSRGRRSRSAT